MTTLHDTEVDGVRCFWVETGRPTLRARLAFRHGMADESVTEAGWQHLIEHVALDRFGRGSAVDINGQVTLHETAFDFHGDPAAVREYLSRLTAWLREPTFERLDHEVGILRAEADVRGSSMLGRALSWRYGARGPGLAAFVEPGLGRANADLLTDRVDRVFTAGNAVLILDGSPPPGIELALSPGALMPIPEAAPVENPPAAYEDGPGIIVSGTVSREGDMFVGAEVFYRVLLERLRHDEGGAYAPWTNYERADADIAVVTAGSDIRPELTGTIVATMQSILDELAARGPRKEWLDETVERMTRGMRDPYAVIGVAVGAGMRWLHGREPESLDQMVDRVRSATVEGVAKGFADLQTSLLIGAPSAALIDRRLRVLTFPSAAASSGEGTAYRSINWPADDSRMRITAGTLEMTGGFGTRVIRLNDVVGWFVYADGLRQAVRSDGYALTVDPRWWVDGPKAVADLDRRIPVELHLPHPAIEGRDAPSREGLIRRWRPVMSRALFLSKAGIAAAMILYLAVVIGILVALGRQGVHGPVPLIAVGFIWVGRILYTSLAEAAAERSV